MKNQTTSPVSVEEKAAYFAQYWLQNVLSNGIELGGVAGDCEGDLFLELTPLSAITDEDAIEVAKIEGSLFNNDASNISRGRNIVDWIFKEDTLSFLGSMSIEIADFLRYKGYAIPFRNYSVEQLIEMGWLKLKP